MSAPQKSPNIIVFLTDEQRHDSIGAYGGPDITPNFDGWAKEGTLMLNAITPQPICVPARACLQTGLYPNQTGCWRNGIALDNRPNKTMADYFAENGYDTAYIGKWDLAGMGLVEKGRRGGYTHWLGCNHLEFTADAYDLVMYNEENQPVRVPGYRADGVADCAIDYLARGHEKPFLLFVSLLEPHCQNHRNAYPGPRFAEQRFAGTPLPPDLATLGGTAHRHAAGYLAMVNRADAAFGRMMDALLSLRMLEDTIVMYGSDHGEHFGTRNSTNKMSPHEASVHVPMLFIGPGFLPGRRVSQPVSLIDVLPTLMDAAHLPPPQNIAGRSMLPLVTDDHAPWPGEVLIQTSETEIGRAIRTRHWKYGVVAPKADPHKQPSAAEYEEAYLYDLENDPYELQNLLGISGFEALKDDLRTKLLAKIAESGEAAPVIREAPNAKQPQGILPQMMDVDENVWDDIANPSRYMKPWDKKE